MGILGCLIKPPDLASHWAIFGHSSILSLTRKPKKGMSGRFGGREERGREGGTLGFFPFEAFRIPFCQWALGTLLRPTCFFTPSEDFWNPNFSPSYKLLWVGSKFRSPICRKERAETIWLPPVRLFLSFQEAQPPGGWKGEIKGLRCYVHMYTCENPNFLSGANCQLS